MSLAETLTETKENLESLVTYSNEITGANDTDISGCIASLVSGFGSGGSASASGLERYLVNQTTFEVEETITDSAVIDLTNVISPIKSSSDTKRIGLIVIELISNVTSSNKYISKVINPCWTNNNWSTNFKPLGNYYGIINFFNDTLGIKAHNVIYNSKSNQLTVSLSDDLVLEKGTYRYSQYLLPR